MREWFLNGWVSDRWSTRRRIDWQWFTYLFWPNELSGLTLSQSLFLLLEPVCFQNIYFLSKPWNRNLGSLYHRYIWCLFQLQNDGTNEICGIWRVGCLPNTIRSIRRDQSSASIIEIFSSRINWLSILTGRSCLFLRLYVFDFHRVDYEVLSGTYDMWHILRYISYATIGIVEKIILWKWLLRLPQFKIFCYPHINSMNVYPQINTLQLRPCGKIGPMHSIWNQLSPVHGDVLELFEFNGFRGYFHLVFVRLNMS